MCKRPWVKRKWLNASEAEVKSFLTGCVTKDAGEDVLLNMIKVTEGLKTYY